jgi:PA14 domain
MAAAPAISTDVASFKTSIDNKKSFMKKVFLDPYFQEEKSAALLQAFGLNPSQTSSEGLLRFNYVLPTGTAPSVPSSGTDMNNIFNGGLSKIDHTILASLNDAGAIPSKGYTIHEFVGTLYIPEAASYTLTATSTGQMEIYINYSQVINKYGAISATSPVKVVSSALPMEMGEVPIKIRFFQLGGAGTDQKFKLEWRKSTGAEADNTVLGCQNLYFNPVLADMVAPQNPEFNKDAFMDNLLNYSQFKKYFGVIGTAMDSKLKDANAYSEIMVAVEGSNFKPFVCSGTPYTIPTGDLMADGRLNGDVNYYHYLNTSLGPVSNGNSIGSLLENIKKLREMYNVLDDTVYERVKSGDTAAVVPTYALNKNADGASAEPMTVLASTVLTSDTMQLLGAVSPVERFVLRRMILLADLVAHAHIAMFLFESVYSSSGTFVCQVKLADMLGHFVNRIKNLNRKYDRMFEAPAEGGSLENEILANLYENIHSFQRNSQKMDQLSRDFKSSKVGLKSNLKAMESEKALYGSGNKWTLGFMIVMVVVIATVIAYSILSQLNPAYKWIGAGAVSALAAVVVLVIYIVKTKKMESFAGDVYNPVSWRDAIGSARAIDVIRDAYQYDLMREIHTYIQNTIHMALILQNAKTYTYINHNLTKELNYYTASKQQVDNARVLAKASTRMYNLETRNNLSRVNVYIALIIILTFAIVGYRLSGESTVLKYTVLIIASVLLLLVALLYVIDVERKVRTDGRKIYWGQPEDLLGKL